VLAISFCWHFSAGAAASGGYKDILIDGFAPPPTSMAPMFPFFENSAAWDDFGEVINPDDYMIKEEHMEQASMQVEFCHQVLPTLFM